MEEEISFQYMGSEYMGTAIGFSGNTVLVRIEWKQTLKDNPTAVENTNGTVCDYLTIAIPLICNKGSTKPQ